MSDEDLTPADQSANASDVPVRLTKAEKLEAKAARLREAEVARAQAAAQAAALAAQFPPSAPTPGAGVSRQKILLGAIPVAVVLVLLLVLTFIYKGQADDRSSQVHKLKKQYAGVPALRSQAATLKELDVLRASAAKTATDVSASFGTYDYKTLTADFARTRAYLTPSFAADFSKLTASLGSLITQDKGQTVGKVEGVGVTSVSTKTAVVIVFLDQTVTTAQSSTPRLDHNRLKLTLARQPDGSWLVSQLSLF